MSDPSFGDPEHPTRVTSLVLCVETGLPPGTHYGVIGAGHADKAIHCTTARYNFAGEDTIVTPPRECVILTGNGTMRCLKPYGHGYTADGLFMQTTDEGMGILVHEIGPGTGYAELVVNGADINANGGTDVKGTGEV